MAKLTEIEVIDLTQHLTGPIMTSMMAGCGAGAIKVGPAAGRGRHIALAMRLVDRPWTPLEIPTLGNAD